MPTYAARDIAAELRRRDPGLMQVKLHKLLYYCQGHHAAAFGRPLFAEPVSAWDMGPVVGRLWREEHDGTGRSTASLDEAALNTIGYVLSRYGRLSGKDLQHLTHQEQPWLQADVGRAPTSSVTIPVDAMAAYFRAEGSEEAGSQPDEAGVVILLSGVEERQRAARSRDSRDDLLARLHAGA